MTMENVDRGQVNQSAAQVYETFFVPALFADWPQHVIEAANVQPGYRVLDVACGTGVAARYASDIVGASGSVTGLDINAGMLAVARDHAPHIDWRTGQAESLPFDDNSFDAVVSQFGLMFFEDRQKALQEMVRVLKPGHTMAVAVWDRLENTPGYAAMISILERLFGEQIAMGLRAPYNLGDMDVLKALLSDAGLANSDIQTYPGQARFPSIRDWVYTDIKGWTLADALDDSQFNHLLREAERTLTEFATKTGAVAFDAPAHVIMTTKS